MKLPLAIILPAKWIPDNTRVYKPTGSKHYTLRHEIKIFGEQGQVVSAKGVIFIVAEDGGINGIRDDEKLRVDFDTVKNACLWLEDYVHLRSMQ